MSYINYIFWIEFLDFIANGPREPGVGAELVSPQKSSNYDIEFNQLNGNKVKDIMNNQLKKYNRIQDYNASKYFEIVILIKVCTAKDVYS